MDLGPPGHVHGQGDGAEPEDFDPYFADLRVKNGFLMVLIEFDTMNRQLKEISESSERLIGMIDRELERDHNRPEPRSSNRTDKEN